MITPSSKVITRGEGGTPGPGYRKKFSHTRKNGSKSAIPRKRITSARNLVEPIPPSNRNPNNGQANLLDMNAFSDFKETTFDMEPVMCKQRYFRAKNQCHIFNGHHGEEGKYL